MDELRNFNWCDFTSSSSFDAALGMAVNGKINMWQFEMRVCIHNLSDHSNTLETWTLKTVCAE